MLHISIGWIVILTAIALCFAVCWYLNEQLKSVHAKLDVVLDQFNGLREYLYEIDPQFNDERQSNERFGEHMANPESTDILSGMDDMELLKGKEEAGKRTLSTSFSASR